MRGALIAVALLAFGLPSSAPGTDPTPDGSLDPKVAAEAGISVYRNNDGLTIVSPWTRGTYPVTDQIEVGVGWEVDAISAASVDVITAATKPFTETRHEGRLSVSMDWADVRANAGYAGSIEPDTYSHTFSVSGEFDLFSRNLTLGVGYGLGADRIGTIAERAKSWRGRTVHQVDLTVTQIVDRDTLLSGMYTFQRQSGFLASAYRRVPLLPPGDDLRTRVQAQWVPERHPELRGRHALSLTVRRAMGTRLFLRGNWRGYLDTWAMRSHSSEISASLDLGDGLLLEVSERIHWQSSVSFYRSVYTVNRDFITADRRLGKLTSNIGGLAIRYQREPFEVVLRGELHWTRYADFMPMIDSQMTPMPDTFGGVAQLGLSLEL